MPGPSYFYIENNIIDDIKLFVRYSIVPYRTKIKLIKKVINNYREKICILELLGVNIIIVLKIS